MAFLDSSDSFRKTSYFPFPSRLCKHQKIRARLWVAFLPLIIVGGILVNWVFLAQLTFAAPAAPSSTPGQNTVQQFLKEGQPSKANQAPFQRPSNPPGALKPAVASTKAGTNIKPLPSAEPAKMHDMAYTLDDSFVLHRPTMKQSSLAPKIQGAAIPAGSTPFAIKGNDGRLEVDVPRGSLDFTHAHLADGSAPVSQLILQLHQISGHSINAESILGTYVLQIVDSQGNVVQGVILTKPATIVYHYQPWEMQDLNLNPTEVSLVWTDLVAAARTTNQSTVGMALPMSNSASAHTLTTQSTQLAGPLTVSGPPEINAPAKPDLFEASGNSGQYTYSYPLSVVPGPDGFAPQLQLTYSSQSTNERYNRRAPSGDEGEGFSLSLGSITAAQYPSSSTGGAATWYSLNGVDGVSDKLVPIPSQPGFYDTQHISHLLIHFTGNSWQVWGLDGTYSILGGTNDSTQKTAQGTYEWDVSSILAPYNNRSQVKAILISYLQDSPDNGTTIRDAGIKQIQYGFSSDTGHTFSLIAGTVDFHYEMPSVPSGQSGFAVAYPSSYYSSCNPPLSTTLRCDDPITYNGLNAPDVMATMSLVAVASYIGSDTTGNLAYNTTLTYQDTPYATNYWYLGGNKTAAAEHLLTQITPTVYVQGAPHMRKSVVFGYATALRVSYDDPSNGFSGQTWWDYLTHYQDLATGVGANITYELGYANPLGTPYVTNSQGQVTDDRFDPFYCGNQANNSDTSKQCNGVYAVHDDYSWSMELVTQISALGTDSTGNPTVATTKYNYALTAVAASNDPVSSCNPINGSGVPPQEASCVMDNWVPGYNGTQTPQHDGDWADYYHAEYRGFNIVYTTSAAGNLTVDDYFSTEGWWKPQSDGLVYNGGKLYQEDVYQGSVATSSALLRETDHDYTSVGNIPAGNTYGGDSCNGLENPVYNPCMQVPLETKTIFYEGQQGGSGNAPWVDTKYTYDDLNSDGSYAYSSTAYHNLLQEVISSSNAPTITKKWQYANTNQTINGWQYYTVGKVTHSETDDSSGHIWNCQDTTYDEGAPGGVPTPDAGLATTVKNYSTCGNSATTLTSYTAYDQYGNAVAMVDPLASANPSLYSSKGCSTSGTVDLSASWTAGRYTSCTSYDTAQTAGLPVSSANALGQSTSTVYDYTSGAQASSDTDVNGQKTSYGDSYDGNGNETISTSAPGESGSYTTRQSENSTCATSSTLPCYEIDTNSLFYSSAISRTFYDAQGRAVETRTPGPTHGDDTVVVTLYNDQNDSVWKSVPFQVADGSGWIDPTNAKDINGIAPAGTTTFSDALGRTLATKDPNFGSAQEPGSNCSNTLSGAYTTCTNYSFAQALGDSNVYALTTSVDPNGHVTQSFADTLGNVRSTQTYSGSYSELAMSLTFNGTGSWTNVQTVTTSVILHAGNNTILFSNPAGAEPNIDRITVGSTSYEAEAAGNTLIGGAIVQSCAPCSGGQQVGYLGGGGSLQFNNITVASAGVYPLTIYYTEGGSTVTGRVGVNGMLLTFNGTGSWTNVQTVTTSVTLQAGNNTILFSNPAGAEPNIDRITVGSTSYEAEAAGNTLIGGAIVQSCAPCSGGQQVGWLGGGSGFQFNTITVASTGTYPLTISYTEGGSTVTGMISINGQPLIKQTQTQYNALNKPTSVAVIDEKPQSGEKPTSVTTTMTYDDQGRLLTMNDPDQGTLTYTYDPDGNILTTVQTSGSNSRTFGFNYDLLGRMGCEQTAASTINATGACSAGSPLLQNTYDTTKLGTQGSTDFPVGQLTQSVATTYYPDSTSASVTEQFQHDQRARLNNEQMQFGLPAGWGITNTLPNYTIAMLYNDANQVTTTSTLAGSEGYTFTNVYDSINGALQGLSNNGNSTSNLAQLAYNEYAQLSGITLLNGAISSPASVASETFNYDANLRPLSLSASWLPGSGNSGQILSQGRTYDNASNVTSVNTIFAAVPGKTGSGGSETQNFCYDEQNRLIWSGNGGTQPGAGNGTCGSGTLASGLSGAGYTAPYSYTNLGQIWQGPVNGQGAAQQYLYCNSAPHQLSGIYPIGTTCTTKGTATAVYSASYDPWGNETSRTYSGTTAALSYDALNRLTAWNVGSNKEWYVYDASGTRVFKRSLSGGVTRLTTYAFGLQELTYGYNGYVVGQADYYSLAGHLLGSTNATTATYDLTDAQGSVLTSLSATTVQGEQIYGPYGNQRYIEGTMGTSKGYTGQFHDSVTGLDYYNARYYDPVSGQFLSVDVKQGNAAGMDPYAYVAGNPETLTDPTGQRYTCGPGGCGGSTGGSGSTGGGGGNPTPPINKAPCELSGGNPAYCGGGGSGSGGGGSTGGGSHGHMGAGIPVNLASPDNSCDATCQQREGAAANVITTTLQDKAKDAQTWIDRLNSNESWFWLGIFAGLPSSFLGEGGVIGVIAMLYGAGSYYQLRNDLIQVFTMERDMLNHVASDFAHEGDEGWTASNILNLAQKELNYMSDQTQQMSYVDGLGQILSPIFIGGSVNAAMDQVYVTEGGASATIIGMSLTQVGYLLPHQLQQQ